jgi:hypothetical protein
MTTSLIADTGGLATLTMPASGQHAETRPSSSPAQLHERMLHRRAVEAAVWGLPMVSYDAMYQAMVRDARGGYNQIGYWSRPSTWKNQTLTPNSESLYVLFFTDTRPAGPLVLDVPPAGDAVLFGSLMDAWQVPLEDVGPAGADAGKGGKYLWLPPGYRGAVPAGYLPLPLKTWQGYALLRTVPKSWRPEDLAKAVAYLKRLRLYPLSDAASPPPTRFVDLTEVVFDGLPPYDEHLFQALDRMVQAEPVQPRDKLMMNLLQSIGIEKGKPFAPDATTARVLAAAAREARDWLDVRGLARPYFPGRQWLTPGEPIAFETEATFETAEFFGTDARATAYRVAFAIPKKMGAGSFYLLGVTDRAGEPFQGGTRYRLTVPPHVPIRQFWALDVYDAVTAAFIREASRVSLCSFDETVRKNADGSVDLYLGPTAPAGKEANWIPTKPGAGFFLIFRLYGPEPSLFDKTWQLPDVETVE